MTLEFPINCISISSDQSYLALCGSDKKITIFNYQQLEKKLKNSQKSLDNENSIEEAKIDEVSLDNHEDSVNIIKFANTSKIF